jgi:type I restriction enzyme R subunit
MRPIFSPSDFVQMKGRGTRLFDFKYNWISSKEIFSVPVSKKENFYMFDFFGNCEYFEETYDYDEKLSLPVTIFQKGGMPLGRVDDEVENILPDPIKTLNVVDITHEGMKIDRVFFDSFEREVKENKDLKEFVKNRDFDAAEEYLVNNILDKPNNFYTLEKLQSAINLDRKLTAKELLMLAFDQIDRIKSKEELIEEEFDKFDTIYMPSGIEFDEVKQFFYAYLTDENIRHILDAKEYAKLNVIPNGQIVKVVPDNYRKLIPEYIKSHVQFNSII